MAALRCYLGDSDRRESLNRFLLLPSSTFSAKGGDDAPDYAVRATMFASWRMLTVAWRPLLVDPSEKQMAEKRLSCARQRRPQHNLPLPCCPSRAFARSRTHIRGSSSVVFDRALTGF